jgi:hypothetical protein
VSLAGEEKFLGHDEILSVGAPEMAVNECATPAPEASKSM